MTCIVRISCFHTTESQHWVYWEYYLYELWVLFVWAGSIICMGKTDALRCQVVTDSESLGGRRAEKVKLIQHLKYICPNIYICLNWRIYLSKILNEIQNVFVVVNFRDKLIGCALSAQVLKYICLNWKMYMSEIQNVFVVVHFRDKLIGCASSCSSFKSSQVKAQSHISLTVSHGTVDDDTQVWKRIISESLWYLK